jgi:gluconokinase
MRIVVMGVAGSGKTTVGEALAARLGADFLDADDAHPPANIAKMAAGEPLTDDDRWPWLARLLEALRSSANVVVTCSALKRRYRDLLRQADGVRFAFLDLDAETARQRAARRQHHFMAANMVPSQYDALERPGPDETDVVAVDATAPVDEVVDHVIEELRAV